MKVYINNKIVKNDIDSNLNVSQCILENTRLKIIYDNGSIEYYEGVKKEAVKVEGGQLLDNTSNGSIENRVADLENLVAQLIIMNGGDK